MGNRKVSVTKELLKALIPYSQQNLKLAYHPNQFFNELEQKTKAKRATLYTTMSRAKKNNLVTVDGETISLRWRGKIKIGYTKPAIEGSSWTLIVFDIKESRRRLRNEFREYLRISGYKPIQLSVWAAQTTPDKELTGVLDELGLNESVYIFSAKKLFPHE